MTPSAPETPDLPATGKTNPLLGAFARGALAGLGSAGVLAAACAGAGLVAGPVGAVAMAIFGATIGSKVYGYVLADAMVEERKTRPQAPLPLPTAGRQRVARTLGATLAFSVFSIVGLGKVTADTFTKPTQAAAATFTPAPPKPAASSPVVPVLTDGGPG